MGWVVLNDGRSSLYMANLRQHLFLVLFAFICGPTAAVSAQVGAPFCYGVGCPCNNDDPLRGCGNSGDDFQVTTGAELLYNDGIPSALQDSLEFSAFGIAANQFGVLFMGGGTNNISFGDGLRCVGGGVVRLEVAFADPGGVSFTTVGIASKGGVQAGDVKRYQLWYRSPGLTSACGNTFNLTNGVEVWWAP